MNNRFLLLQNLHTSRPIGWDHAAAVGDIYVGNGTEARPYFLINDGAGNFEINWQFVPDIFFEQSEGNQNTTANISVLLADLDEDGNVDFVTGPDLVPPADAHFDGWIAWNPGNGDFSQADKTFFPRNEIWPFTQPRMAAFDIDKDGDRDLLIPRERSDSRNKHIQILVNHGSRTFIDETAARFPTQPTGWDTWFNSLEPADLDNDGCQDLYTGGGPFVYMNDCQGNFSRMEFDILGRPRMLFALDVDQDGDLDFLSQDLNLGNPVNPGDWYQAFSVLEKIGRPEIIFRNDFEEMIDPVP